LHLSLSSLILVNLILATFYQFVFSFSQEIVKTTLT